MGAILLDSTVIIDVLRGRPLASRRLLALRDTNDVPYVCAISVEEIYRALKPAEAESCEAFFEGVYIAPLGLREGTQAGEWRQRFAAQGTTLAQADCLIAAAAFSLNARLATGNVKDFPMSEIEVEHWPVGK